MLTEVDSIRVGHSSDYINKTGCTVIIFDAPTVGGVDVRGANPGTKDTDLLRPMSSMPEIHAILLTGGSSFGLEAAIGVMRYLESVDCGYKVGTVKIPIVPAAVIYDLGVGSARVRPDIAMGIKACEQARSGDFERGSVGAGTGATIGKLHGTAFASNGGVGTSLVTLRSGVKVGALMVVNCFGDVVDFSSGRILAGSKDDAGNFVNTYQRQKEGVVVSSAFRFTNTTIGVVSCNCRLTKEEANRVAVLAQNGLARTVSPCHTAVDGDAIFATGRTDADLRCPVDLLGNAAAEAVELAVLDARRSAGTSP